jgi:hypothetical protein
MEGVRVRPPGQAGLHPRTEAADERQLEVRALLILTGVRPAARALKISAGQLVNIAQGRRRATPELVARLRSLAAPEQRGLGGHVRLLSGADYKRIYGHDYPVRLDDEEDGPEDGSWGTSTDWEL